MGLLNVGGNLSLLEAAQSANVELAVITALAEMALDRFTQTAKHDSVAIETIGLESDANSDRGENQQENEQLLVGSSQTTETKNVKDEDNFASVEAEETQSSRDRSSEKEEDLSVYLTKQPPKSIQPEKSSFDNRVEFMLQANNLYFGWQQLLKQNQLVVDEITQHKVTEVINLVRRGNSIEAAIERVGLEKEIGSRLIAIANQGVKVEPVSR
jgi:hypothetical protein